MVLSVRSRRLVLVTGMPKRSPKYDRTHARKKRVSKQKLGTPAGVIQVHAPSAPKPYLGRGADVKWFNGIIQPNEPYTSFFTGIGDVQHLNRIAQGTGQNRRIGNAYRNLGIHLRGWIDQGAANSGGKLARDTLRVSVVWDRSPNKVLASYSEIYNVSPASLAGTALPNYTEEDRFTILATKTYTMQSGASDQVGRKRMDLDEYIGFPRNLITKHVGGATGGEITVQNTGALLLCIGGSLDSSQTDQFSELYCHFKLFYDERTA